MDRPDGGAFPFAGKVGGHLGQQPFHRNAGSLARPCQFPGHREAPGGQRLRPFGEAVRDEEWDQQEFDDGTGTASGSFVFYVPENRQGTIGGIQTSREKSPDANDEVRARSNRLTYLETTVEGTGTILGTIVYRSYLGRNAVTDFDILRNARYEWTLRFLPDGLQYDDWKHDNDLIDSQTGLHISDGWDDGGETDLH